MSAGCLMHVFVDLDAGILTGFEISHSADETYLRDESFVASPHAS